MEGDSKLTFPPELPISARVTDIAVAINDHPVVIVAGATGSGKTTQLPKIALAMGRGLEQQIGVTQPRRLAATSVAARVATEIGCTLGAEVGYQVRFDDRTSRATYVKFMTDGIMLAEINGDPLLQRYDTIVIDEAHERSLTIDFLLGWLKRILPERPDLKVIISSATLETERFSAFFGGAPVIEVQGRTYPVDVLYEPPAKDVDLAEAVADAVTNVTGLDPHGDILVFLPGEREIRDTEHALHARELRHTVVQPLYARLSAADQARVFTRLPQRRVILATNVAETSITIPGIVYVVDAGLARLSRYDGRSGITRLQVEGISQASADQRKGRCGRVRAGVCVRLYDEASFESRPAFTDPEIKRTGLAGVILRMKSLGLGDVEDFSFLDPPESKAIAEGYRVLEELGAIDQRELTKLGEQLARFPVDPRIGRMILAGAEQGCLREILIVAAALNVQDPRDRPREQRQKADDLHRRFADERSDFMSLLRLWDFVRDAEKKGSSNLRRVCRDSFLSWLRVREWTEIHRQLEDIVKELGLQAGKRSAPVPEKKPDENALHRALLVGLLSKVGLWNAEARVYLGARQTRFALHPSSSLARKPPAWVMAFELVETTQLFARQAAKVDPEWLLEVAPPHLLKRSYSEPNWSEKSGRASIREHVTLFGLTVAKDRSVDYASVAPAAARQMFLDHALVRGEYRSRGDFQEQNRALMETVAKLRDKARQSDMMADDEALKDFFDARVPDTVCNGQRFEVWREAAEKSDPRVLHLTLADVLVGEHALRPSDFPDTLRLHGSLVTATYKFDLSAEDDGVTLAIPLGLLPQLDPGELDWTMPGWQAEKILYLLHDLPKPARRELSEAFGSLNDAARSLTASLVPFEGPMLPALAKELSALTSSRVTPELFHPENAPRHLRFFFEVLGEGNRTVVAEGRDLAELQKQLGVRARDALKSAVAETPSDRKWERSAVVSWDFGDLHPFVLRRVAGVDVRTYPAIVDRGASVDLALLESSAAAEEASRRGVRRLFILAARRELSSITASLPRPLASPTGALETRAHTDAFHQRLLGRIVDGAFGLEGGAPFPRTKAAFDAQLRAGLPKLDGSFRLWSQAVRGASIEVDRTLAALKAAAKHPSGRAALLDVQAQLEALLTPDLVGSISVARLEQYPRYLRAAQTRLTRAAVDPRKDAEKLGPVTALWTTFVAKQRHARPDEAADVEALRWLFEELRVSVFAPELKTPVPVSAKRITDLIAGLSGPGAR